MVVSVRDMSSSPTSSENASPTDAAIRMAMFRWLEEKVALHGDVLPRNLLAKGFPFGDALIPALHPAGRGIWKPKQLDAALSLTTTVNSPYSDRIEEERLLYSYQGTDPQASDNRAVRRALSTSTPVAYFHGVEKGWYFAAWPMFIVGDEPEHLRFSVQAEPAGANLAGASISGSMDGAMITNDSPRRAYGTSQVRIRIHQRGFRERVLAAYKSRCAMCNLKHRELLDAAHIIPDSEGGEPHVTNGLALCKIHHAAFDKRIIGVQPDGYRIAVRESILQEVDGPMLRHGIQELHGRKLWVPRSADKKPDPKALLNQWQRFVEAS
jgi:putative restriction endonuclease